MTDHGMKVLRANAQGQIDSNYQNFKLIGVDETAVAAGYNYVYPGMGSLLEPNEVPFISLKADSSYYMALANVSGGASYRIKTEGALTAYSVIRAWNLLNTAFT